MIKYFLLFISVSCVFSCNNKTNSNSVSSGGPTNKDFYEAYRDKKLLNELSKKVVLEGDTIAFKRLKDIYLFSENEREFLYYSIYMADNFDYRDAYMTTYVLLHSESVNQKNIASNKLANYYLLKSFETGDNSALSIIKKRFGVDNIPSSKKYWDSIRNNT